MTHEEHNQEPEPSGVFDEAKKEEVDNPAIDQPEPIRGDVEDEFFDENLKKKKKIAPHSYSKNYGRIADLPRAERQELARRGGKANLGGTKFHRSKCINCDIRNVCRRAFEESFMERRKGKLMPDSEAKCVIERDGRHGLKVRKLRDFCAFTGTDPTALLEKIHSTYEKLEQEVQKNPSYTKLTNMIYILINIYKLKFGEKALVKYAEKGMTGNPTVDVKVIMQQIRGNDGMIQQERGGVPKIGKPIISKRANVTGSKKTQKTGDDNKDGEE